jgi:hypothetical protein
VEVELAIGARRRLHEEIDGIGQLPLLDVVGSERLEQVHAAAPVVGEAEALAIQGGAAGAEEQVVHPDVVAHDLQHRLAVLVDQPVADAKREAAQRRPGLMGRDRLPEIRPLEGHEIGDLGALEVDHRQVFSRRGKDRSSLPCRDDDGTLLRIAHRNLLPRSMGPTPPAPLARAERVPPGLP